jgi:hypothetical protein
MLRLIGKISLLLSIIGTIATAVYVYPYLKWPDANKEELEAFAKECKDISMELDGRSKDDLDKLKIITDDLREVLDQYEIFDEDRWPPFDYGKDDNWDEHYALITKHDEALANITEDGFVFQQDALDLSKPGGGDIPELRPLKKLLIWQMAAACFEMNHEQKEKALTRIEMMMTISRELMDSPSMFPMLFGIVNASTINNAVLQMTPQLDSRQLKKLNEWCGTYPDPVDVFIRAFQYEVHDAASMFDLGVPRLIGAGGKDGGNKVGYAILKWIRWPQREKAVYLSVAKMQINYFKAWDESGRKGDPVFIDPDVDLQNSIMARIAWTDTGKYFAKVRQHQKRTKAMKTVLDWYASSEDIQAMERREVEYDDEYLIVVESGKVRMEKKGEVETE